MTDSVVTLQFSDFSGQWKRGVDVPGHGVHRGVTGGLKQGDWVAVIGDNGMGKSTLLSAMAGLAPFSHGVLKYDQIKLHPGQPFQRFKSSLAYVGQDASYPEGIEFDHLARLYFRNRGAIANSVVVKQQISETLEKLGKTYEDRNSLSTRVMEFILAISIVPSILILDEIGPEFKREKIEANPYSIVEKYCPNAIVFVVDHDRKRAIAQCKYLMYLGDPSAHDTMQNQEKTQPVFRKYDDFTTEELSEISGDQAELENYVAGTNSLRIENDETVASLLFAAVRASDSFSFFKTKAAYKELIKEPLSFLADNKSDYSKLSGGQKVVMSAIVQKLILQKNPAPSLLEHLSSNTRKALKERLEYIGDGTTS